MGLLFLSAVLKLNQADVAVAQGVAPAWRIEDVSIVETNDANNSATLTISLSKPSTQTVSVNWNTVDGTARSPFDYAASAGKVILKPGETSKIITVPLVGDLSHEPDEQFYILLSLPVNSSIGVGRATVAVEDNDALPTISVENQNVAEGDSASVVASFRLRLSAPSGKVVRVRFATQEAIGADKAKAGDDYETVPPAQVAFNVGSTVALVRVPIKGDTIKEANEKFFINLSDPSEGTLGNAQGTITILDDDISPALSISDVVVNEGTQGSEVRLASFQIGLSAPCGQTVSVKWGTADGTAKANSDYTPRSGTLQLVPGVTSRAVSVPIAADTLTEANESFFAFLSEPQGASIARARGEATILNGRRVVCPPLTRIRFIPRPGYASRLFRGRFYGSNAGPQEQLQFITDIKTMPLEGRWNEVVLEKPVMFRYLKFEATNNSYGSLAEIEFLWDNVRISGTPLGSASTPGSVNTFQKAFDNDAGTFFEGELPNDQWVALDLGASVQAVAPVFRPVAGSYAAPLNVTIVSATPGAKIRVSRGSESIFRNTGADPTRETGEVVNGPVTLNKSTVLTAIAYTDDLAASPAVTGGYAVGNSAFNGIRTFHVGNSLTFGMDRWLQPLVQSAGRNFDYHRYTHSGAAIDYLWKNPGSGFGDTHYREALSIFAPFDHIFTQPFAGRDNPLENEAEYSQKFFDLARQNSPNVQAWLYAQWPGRPFSDNRSQGRGSALVLQLRPALTWQEGVENHLRFIEAVRARLLLSYTGRPVGIVPAGLALARLKTEIEAGRVPGMTDFFRETSADGLHLTPKGNYLISLVFYSCLFKESPEGKVSILDSGLTPEQAAIFQRIAWETARDYPFSGVLLPVQGP